MLVKGSPKLHGSRSLVSPAECARIKGENARHLYPTRKQFAVRLAAKTAYICTAK